MPVSEVAEHPSNGLSLVTLGDDAFSEEPAEATRKGLDSLAASGNTTLAPVSEPLVDCLAALHDGRREEHPHRALNFLHHVVYTSLPQLVLGGHRHSFPALSACPGLAASDSPDPVRPDATGPRAQPPRDLRRSCMMVQRSSPCPFHFSQQDFPMRLSLCFLRVRRLDILPATPRPRPAMRLVPVEEVRGQPREREAENPYPQLPGAVEPPRDGQEQGPLRDPQGERRPVPGANYPKLLLDGLR